MNEMKKRKVFVIGDSISLLYGPHLERFLKDSFEYSRKGYGIVDVDLNDLSINGRTSRDVLEYVESRTDIFDIVVFNCGLHDVKYTDSLQISLNEYVENLKQIVASLSRRCKALVFVNSTPVDDVLHNAQSETFKRFESDVLRYNDAAQKIMKECGVYLIDLHEFTKTLSCESLYMDHVHFTDEVSELQAAYIAGILIGKYV